MSDLRKKLRVALDKPLPMDYQDLGDHSFDPWEDIIAGIYGNYASESDNLMICALKAVRDRVTFDFIEERGFAAEFALYVLAGHGLLEYGTSPRGGWPDDAVADMWDELIAKWERYADVVWK